MNPDPLGGEIPAGGCAGFEGFKVDFANCNDLSKTGKMGL